MRIVILNLILLISVVNGSKIIQKPEKLIMAAPELLLLPNGQSLSIFSVGTGESGPGKAVKTLKVTAGGYTGTQGIKATSADVESTLQDYYKVDIRPDDLKEIVATLNTQNAPKKTIEIKGYDRQPIILPGPSNNGGIKGQILGGKNNCDQATRLADIQKILDGLHAKDIIEPWKIHSDQIQECNQQVVQGIKYKFKITLGVHVCSFNVVSFMKKLTMYKPEELFFACPQILKPDFREHVKHVIRNALKKTELKTEIEAENWKIEESKGDLQDGPIIKVGGVSECTKDQKLKTARSVLAELDKQNILRPWKIRWQNVLSCTNQVTSGLTTRVTINIGGIACELTVRSLSKKTFFENAFETHQHCGGLFDPNYHVGDLIVEPVIYKHPVLQKAKSMEVIQVVNKKEEPHMVGGPVSCFEGSIEEEVNGYLDRLENRYFNKLAVKKADISDCTTQSVLGMLAIFTIKVNGKQCKINMTVYSKPPKLNNAKTLLKECPELFIKDFKPDEEDFRRNLLV